jgi:hypothetical protein
MVRRKRIDKSLRKMSVNELLAAGGKTNPLKGRPFTLGAHRTQAEDNMPLPPEILADARQDVCHNDIGKGRAAKSTKVRMDGTVVKEPRSECYDVSCDVYREGDDGECEHAYGVDVEWNWGHSKVVVQAGSSRIELSTRSALALIARIAETLQENA